MKNSKRFAVGRFVGSKNADGVYHKIINLIPPCSTFIELFAGTAAITRHLRPAAETVLVDVVDRPELRALARKMRGARFLCTDGIAFASRYKFTGREFIYADPPYLGAARAQRGRAYYGAGEMLSEAEHARLLRTLRAINCRVLLSGYPSPLYDRELADWGRVEFEVMTLGGSKATEVLWFNYPRPCELHDYRYVGETWRERQDLRRMIAKAVARVASMPPLKRNAFLDGLRDFWPMAVAAVERGLPPSPASTRGECTAEDLSGDSAAGARLLAAQARATLALRTDPSLIGSSILAGETAIEGERHSIRVELRKACAAPRSTPSTSGESAAAAATQVLEARRKRRVRPAR